MRLYLIRHGQSTWNLQNRIQGHSNPPLDRIGILQSRKLARHLNGFNISRFYSSPLSRARQTALILSQKLNIKGIEFLDDLKEINLGLWEGKTPAQVDRQFKESYKRWLDKPMSVAIPSAEPINHFKKRVVKTFTSIIEKNNKEDNLIIVTHGGVIMAYVSHILKVDFGKLLFRLRLDNSSITIIDVFNRELKSKAVTRDIFISAINITPHLISR